MALLVSGTRCELREVKLSDKPGAMLEASPKGTVPVLKLSDGAVLEESLAIMDWALARRDPENWLARKDDDLIARNDGPFKHALDRYKYPNRYDSDPEEYRSDGLAILRDLEARLSGARQLSGERAGYTDTAIMPFVRQFAATDREWWDAQDLPKLQNWLADHLESALFRRCMVKHKPWQPGNEPVLFPQD
ncbi:Glutathione S-transferase domain protein [Aurantiacibacter gangjinensis]|nr:Glutathione S-transferase domain protein [Aurantiacibacter gangjinensis]